METPNLNLPAPPTSAKRPFIMPSIVNTPSRTIVPVPGPASRSFEEAASSVLEQLQTALADLLAASPEHVRRPTDVEEVFGVDYRLSWQVFRIANSKNPLAAGAHVPARVSMKKLLKAAARRRVPRAIIDRVNAAFDDFERFVETDAGDRATMDSMLGALLPEERDKHELLIKQAAFKAMGHIIGVSMEADISTTFRVPSGDGRGIDTAALQGHLGLRRVRSGAPIVFINGDVNPRETTTFSLDGDLVMGSGNPLLSQFCSSPLPQFDKREEGGCVYYSVSGNDVGLRSAIDLFMASRRAGAAGRYHVPNEKTHASHAYWLDCPSKRATIDYFIHRDLYPGVQPELAIYDMANVGVVTKFNDPNRERHKLQLHETIRPLGMGLANAKLSHVPRYIEMLECVCAKLRWDPADFRAYRLDVQYPVYGAEYLVGFKMPEAPSGR